MRPPKAPPADAFYRALDEAVDALYRDLDGLGFAWAPPADAFYRALDEALARPSTNAWKKAGRLLPRTTPNQPVGGWGRFYVRNWIVGALLDGKTVAPSEFAGYLLMERGPIPDIIRHEVAYQLEHPKRSRGRQPDEMTGLKGAVRQISVHLYEDYKRILQGKAVVDAAVDAYEKVAFEKALEAKGIKAEYNKKGRVKAPADNALAMVVSVMSERMGLKLGLDISPNMLRTWITEAKRRRKARAV